MDLAPVRADELTEETAPPPSRTPLLLACLLLLALLAVAAVLGARFQHRSQERDVAGSTAGAEQAALQAAQGEALALTTIDYRTANRDLDRILAGATGPLAKQFAAQRAKFPDSLRPTKSVSKGTVLSAALSPAATDLPAGKAQAVVAVDAAVSGSGSSSVVKHYRMVVSLQRVSGRWLADDVAFSGEPQ